MHSLMAVVAVVLTTGGVVAQGGFMFANRCTFCTPPVDARLFELDGVTPLEGTAYSAQACVKRVEEPAALQHARRRRPRRAAWPTGAGWRGRTSGAVF